MEQIMRMNYGQHMLFTYLCISLEGRSEIELTREELMGWIDTIIDLTDVRNYDSIEECPDHMIMVNPQNSYQIFCDFWEEIENFKLIETKHIL